MEGITILEEHILHGPSLISEWLTISGIISITLGMFFLLTDLVSEDDCEIPILILLVGGTLSFLVGLLTISIIPGPPTDQARYIIRVEEKVNMNELLNNYKIINHEKYSNIYEIEGGIINDN